MWTLDGKRYSKGAVQEPGDNPPIGVEGVRCVAVMSSAGTTSIQAISALLIPSAGPQTLMAVSWEISGRYRVAGL